MIKFFYQVEYNYETEAGCISSFNLGVFSTLKNAQKKISQSKDKIGFSEHPNGFKITKFGVDFSKKIFEKSGVELYFIYHEYTIIENDEYIDVWNQFDCFSTQSKAKEKIEQLKKHSRLGKKYPNNFLIDKVIVDNYSNWSEGFASWQEK